MEDMCRITGSVTVYAVSSRWVVVGRMTMVAASHGIQIDLARRASGSSFTSGSTADRAMFHLTLTSCSRESINGRCAINTAFNRSLRFRRPRNYATRGSWTWPAAAIRLEARWPSAIEQRHRRLQHWPRLAPEVRCWRR